MSEEKKRPGLQKKTREEIRATFNKLRDACGLELRVLASDDGRATVVTEDDDIVEGMDSMSGLTLCKAVEIADLLLRHQTQFHTEHAQENLRGAPPAEAEDESYLQDLADESDQAQAV